LIALAQSVVREAIANNTIDNIIKNRTLLTDKIRKDLAPICKGWGMFLERVDIRDVKICSGQLFSDIQSEFRLNQRKDAEIKTITSTNFLNKEKMKVELEDAFRQAQIDKNKSQQQIRRETERLSKDMQNNKQTIAISKRSKERSISE
jgi:regulator of protease activity HflC (stomatin/prohibitin superfamily)